MGAPLASPRCLIVNQHHVKVGQVLAHTTAAGLDRVVSDDQVRESPLNQVPVCFSSITRECACSFGDTFATTSALTPVFGPRRLPLLSAAMLGDVGEHDAYQQPTRSGGGQQK